MRYFVIRWSSPSSLAVRRSLVVFENAAAALASFMNDGLMVHSIEPGRRPRRRPA